MWYLIARFLFLPDKNRENALENALKPKEPLIHS